MKKLLSTYLLNIIAAVALMMTAAACVDDTDLPEVAAPGTSVTIRIPNPAAADAFARSRAEEKDMDADAGEGKINSLWLLAYNTTNPDYNVIRQLESSGQLTHEYSEYRVEFKPGKYRIYVVANLDPYITKAINASTTEDALKGLILNFSSEKLPNTADGLPMACLPAQVDGATDGYITVEAGTTKTIQTDLTFLCAKVRYTILFDNSEGGFSREAFGSSAVTFNTASLTGVRGTTALDGSVNASADAFEVDPIDLKAVNDSKDLNDLADPGFTPSATGAQRAWQGTMYLPENLLTGARTILHLGATLDGNGANLSYTVKLPKNDNNAASPDNTLTRGHFYDLVGKVTTIGDQIDITASVADWTLQQLTYDLHGPYFLHVEKTKIEDLVAGLEETFTYETDAPDITFESCKYKDTGKDLFTVTKSVDEETGKNYISVKVNPEIAASGETLTGNEYYFDIIAANLHKRILVTPVKLTPFLNVIPTEIEINIAEYIASGDYEAEIPIEFTTNLTSVTITGDSGWDNSKIELEGDKSYTGESTGTNILKIKGFNEAKWTAKETFILTYTATNGTNTETEPVKITVKPNILDYLIHFRAPSDWTHPHIYVYQCLQVPQTRGDEYVGKTVGYYNDNSSDLFSALEYSFTGKIAFKGWDGTTNNPKGDGTCETSTLGFFVFKDQTGWDPNRSGFTNRYYDNFDFCKLHRDSVSYSSVGGTPTECNACSTNPNRLWPGILMHDDGNTWWTFKLTGVATPGKALIMFNDQHSDKGRRYPALDENNKSQPGIPLFDYPSREGWFDLANFATQFSPSPNSVNRPQKVRIYWSKPADNNKHFYIWTDSNTGITNWSNEGKESEKYPSYLYYEFSVTSDMSFSTIFKYQLKQNSSVTKEIKISSFAKIDGGKTLVATLDENGNFENSGTPKEYGPEPALANNTYRIYWAKSTGWNYLWVWNCGNVNLTASEDQNNTAYSMTGQYRGADGVVYNYFDFTPKNPNENNFWFNTKLKADPGNVWTNGASSDINIYKALFTNRRHKAI